MLFMLFAFKNSVLNVKLGKVFSEVERREQETKLRLAKAAIYRITQ